MTHAPVPGGLSLNMNSQRSFEKISEGKGDSGAIATPGGSSESGFTLIETSIALVIILIGLLGVFYTITYSILYNSGNAMRAQTLATLQQEVEQIRSKKFTPTIIDPDLLGGTKPIRTVNAPNGGSFSVAQRVDDDPFTDGVQVDNASAIKEITVVVRLTSPAPGWQTAVPATIVMRRTRGN